MARTKWTNSEINILKKYYNEQGATYCSTLIKGKSKKKISTKAGTLGINYRGKYYLNADLFLKPTTPEVCYLLGLIWANGYVNLNRGNFSIKLVSSDMAQIIPTAHKIGKWSICYEKPKNGKKSCRIGQVINKL